MRAEGRNPPMRQGEAFAQRLLQVDIPPKPILDADLHDAERPGSRQHAGDVGPTRFEDARDVVLGPPVKEVHAGGLDHLLSRARNDGHDACPHMPYRTAALINWNVGKALPLLSVSPPLSSRESECDPAPRDWDLLGTPSARAPA